MGFGILRKSVVALGVGVDFRRGELLLFKEASDVSPVLANGVRPRSKG